MRDSKRCHISPATKAILRRSQFSTVQLLSCVRLFATPCLLAINAGDGLENLPASVFPDWGYWSQPLERTGWSLKSKTRASRRSINLTSGHIGGKNINFKIQHPKFQCSPLDLGQDMVCSKMSFVYRMETVVFQFRSLIGGEISCYS